MFWLLIFVPDDISQPIAPEDWFLLSAIAAPLYTLAWRMEMHGQPR